MKTKIQKGFIAIIVAIIIIMANVMPVFASISSSANTSSITITGLEAGVTAYIYQLTTVNYNYVADQPYDPEYVWETSLQDWIFENYSDYINFEYNDDGEIEGDGSVSSSFSDDLIASDSDEVKAFYSELIAAIKGGEISLTRNSSATESSGAGQGYPVDEDDCIYEIN